MIEDEGMIRDIVDSYVTGFSKGKKELLGQALHPRSICSGFLEGELHWDTADEFTSFCEQAPPDPDGPVPEWKLENLVVSGQTAVAIVRDAWGSRQFRDSLTLLKDEGRWQIVFKAVHNLD